jgi:hypothetical protein
MENPQKPAPSKPMPVLKLPREVETDPRNAAVVRALALDMRPLWEKGTFTVPHVSFQPALEKALAVANRDRHLERGFEKIETILKGEQKGLAELREKQGTPPANRVSRLLIIPDECPERFYRNCETILFNHSDRLLGLRVKVPFNVFAENIFGKEALVKVLLVTDRKAAANVLFAIL